MSHGRGRRQPNQSYSGYRQAPTNSSYSAPSMRPNDPYYEQEYGAYRQGYAGYDAALAQQSQTGAHDSTWSYGHEQDRGGYDQRTWAREGEERTQHEYDDYYNYRGDAQRPLDLQQEPYNRQWRDYVPGYPYAAEHYSRPEERYSDYSSYNDYSNRAAEYQQTNYGSGYSDYRRPQEAAYPPPRGDSRGGGYSEYRRAPLPVRERDYEEGYSNYGRRSPSPLQPAQSRGFSSRVRGPVTKPYIVKPHISKAPSPFQVMTPKVTEPREEYLSISLRPSVPLSDPTAGPTKLLVLDLNGSLVLRAAHKRSQLPLGRGVNAKKDGALNAPFDPYADPTQIRPLRAVHRRPYLTSFTAYILHEETKKWLETMVWSSAQPHSVADMVEHCFGERKAELKAVWARDTLGLSSDDYNKKSVTLKDLEKPCAQLLSPGVVRDSKQPQSSPDNRRSQADDLASPSVRSALSALLVDDSPAKAALQPWNHLVIKDYVQSLRNHDLNVADWESNLERHDLWEKQMALSEAVQPSTSTSENGDGTQKGTAYTGSVTEEDVDKFITQTISETSPDTKVSDAEANVVRRVIHEIIMIDGEMVDPEKSILKDTAIMDVDPVLAASNSSTTASNSEFIPNLRRKQKRLAKKELARKEREEKEREAFNALRDKQGLAERARQEQMAQWIGGDEKGNKNKNKDDIALVLRYDETLLAVVGVLDQIKHESNVAGWLRSGGLMNVALSSVKSKTDSTTTTTTTTAPEVSSESIKDDPNILATPVETSSAIIAGKKHRAPTPSPSPGPDENQSSSSPGRSPAKRRKLSANNTNQSETQAERDNAKIIPSPQSPSPKSASAEADAKEQASTGVPLSSPVPAPASLVLQHNQGSGTVAPAPVVEQQEPGLWYENSIVLFYWADRGRNALRELGIPVDSGMVANPRVHVKNAEKEARVDINANAGNANANTNANGNANVNGLAHINLNNT